MYQSWKRTNALDTCARASRILIKFGQEINMKRDVKWLLVWNGICQCKKKQTALASSCSKIKLKISLRGLHECIQKTLFTHTSKLGSACPNTDGLATSNGVCTKGNMARFGLFLFENKVNNNLQTWPLIHLTSLATFNSKILLRSEVSYACERIILWIWRWRWIWTKWQISFLLDTY